jgi:Virulence activator alpha C-term
VTSEKQPGKTRKRTVYRLTTEGRQALREWLRLPAGFPKLQHEASMRLFAGDMIRDEEILASLQRLRTDIAEMSVAVETNIARAPSLPHRTRYLLLLQDLGRRLLQAHADWLDDVERELSRDRVQ